ncbi:hypothetical protein ACKWTF_014826 [Chironomus riparius]
MWKLFSKILFLVFLTSTVDGFFWSSKTLSQHYEEFKTSNLEVFNSFKNFSCIDNKIKEAKNDNVNSNIANIFIKTVAEACNGANALNNKEVKCLNEEGDKILDCIQQEFNKTSWDMILIIGAVTFVVLLLLFVLLKCLCC